MATGNDDGAMVKRAQNAIMTYALSMYAILGHSPPGDDRLGQMAKDALPFLSPSDLKHPESPNLAALGQLQQMVMRDIGASRPRNDFSAEAARAAQAAGSDGARGGAGFGYIDAIRAGSSARYRELSGSDGKAGSGTSSTASAGNPVTPEFARSFAGTGMVGGTLRTFAAVGLDRDTFNAFRDEGFSKAQIVDSAQDSKALGWKGKEDLSIAQHASPEARKAAVATEQATTPEQREEGLKRERALEEKNKARPDSDPQKRHDQRFFERRHQDHLRHSAKAGLGTESRQRDAALPAPTEKTMSASHSSQDGLMAKGTRTSSAAVKSVAVASFEIEADTPPATTAAKKPTPIKVAMTKPAAPTQG